jgi:hypothetical protein
MGHRPFIRCLVLLSLAACCAFAFAPTARAVEMQVEILTDSLAQPPAPLSNVCTLRKAINNANDNAATYPQCQAGDVGNDTIVFNLPGTITFALPGTNEDGGETGDLDITDSLTIIGHPDGTTINAADLDRVFHIHPGIVVTLRNINITNGTGPGGGGGILLSGATLNLENCTVSNSFANGGDGGGILMTGSAILNMTNSTVSGNVAEHHAGAMVVESGTANITNSTITNNSSLTGLTGGIRNTGIVILRSTIVAGNTNISPQNFIPNLDGTFNSLGYNVIGDLGAQPGNPNLIALPTDQVGVSSAQLNLGSLQNNGGPTPTHALQAGSVAIDKGHSSGSTTDQRGEVRPCDLAAVSNALGGDGGDAGAFEEQGACVIPNQSPDAVDDAALVNEDSGPNAINVLANDTDPNGDTLTVTAVTQGAHGSVAITGGGTGVSYAPAPNFFGADSFTYTIGDGNGGTDTATVTVNVASVNDAPVASPDAYDTNSNTPLVVPAPGVLANDTDVDGDALAAQLVSGPTHAASFALNPNGSFNYTPTLNFAGADSFTYRANDGTVNSNTVTVTITVHDTVPPNLTSSVATASLWPPNHDLVNVGLSVAVSDNSGDPVTTQVFVFSDEDDVTGGGGEMSPDAKNIAPGTLRLRSERDGGSDGRVYLIVVVATDSSNNVSRNCLTVVVPHSQSKASKDSVNAQAAAARQFCETHGGAPPPGYFVVGDGPVVGPKQ